MHNLPIVNPIHPPIRSYIVNMAGRYNNYDNVADFIEYKMGRIIRRFTSMQRHDIASAMTYALEEYLAGNIDIVFVDGWPNASEIAHDT